MRYERARHGLAAQVLDPVLLIRDLPPQLVQLSDVQAVVGLGQPAQGEPAQLLGLDGDIHRLQLDDITVVEDFLNALTARGLTDQQAVSVYRSFTSFLLGQLLLETASMGAPTSPAEEPLNAGDADVPTADAELDLTPYPTVTRLQRAPSDTHPTAEFEQALETLLDRLDLQLSQ